MASLLGLLAKIGLVFLSLLLSLCAVTDCCYPYSVFRMASGGEWIVAGGKRKAPASKSVTPGPGRAPDPAPARGPAAAVAAPSASTARIPEGPRRPASAVPPVGLPRVSLARVFRTLEVSIPRGGYATRAEVVAALASVVALRDVEGIVRFSGGWQVTFTSFQGLARVGPTLLVNGVGCEVRPVAEKKDNGCVRWLDSFRVVRVHWLPFFIPPEAVGDVLAPYGRVISVSEANGLDGIPNGVKVVKLETGDIEAIPHLTKVFFEGRNFPALFTVPGRAPLCLKCRATGHIRGSCPSRGEGDSYAARAAKRVGGAGPSGVVPAAVAVDPPRSDPLPQDSVGGDRSDAVEPMAVDGLPSVCPVPPPASSVSTEISEPVQAVLVPGGVLPRPQRAARSGSDPRRKRSKPSEKVQGEVAPVAPVVALVSLDTGPEMVLGSGSSDGSWADSPEPDDLPPGLAGGLLPIPDLVFPGPSPVSPDPSLSISSSGGSSAGGRSIGSAPLPSSPSRLPRAQSRGAAPSQSQSQSQSGVSAPRPRSRSSKGSF